MNTAIRIENLGKKYTITRQRQSGSGYVSLRDVLSDGTKRMVQKILHPRGERGEEGASGTQEFWALKDINLEVEQGDKLAIIGHNGAGKSTLLKVLSRITEPTTGRITLQGRIASLLEVGTGFHPELTGRENIFLNGSILGMSQREIKHKFDEIVDFSGVETFLDTPVKRYSSGMRMRLGFAVAAHLDSEILVIDEVLAVGDAEFQRKCLGKMNDVSRTEEKTILFVSHNMSAIQQLCNKGVVMDAGQVVFNGKVTDAISLYDNIQYNENDYRVVYSNEKVRFLGVNKFENIKDSLFLELTFFVEEDISDCFLDFAIADRNGVYFIHYVDNAARVNGSKVSKGKNKFCVEVTPVRLNSGLFTLTINLKRRSGDSLFWGELINLPDIIAPSVGTYVEATLAPDYKLNLIQES